MLCAVLCFMRNVLHIAGMVLCVAKAMLLVIINLLSVTELLYDVRPAQFVVRGM